MVGLGVASCEKQFGPSACLKVAPTSTEPGAVDASAPPDTGSSEDASKPEVKLKQPKSPAKPEPCLSFHE